jgi:hypothetical protein
MIKLKVIAWVSSRKQSKGKVMRTPIECNCKRSLGNRLVTRVQEMSRANEILETGEGKVSWLSDNPLKGKATRIQRGQ